MTSINHILGAISRTTLLGFIPLDLLLHLLIGSIITVIPLSRKISYPITFIIVASLSLLKEIYDIIFVFPTHWTEYVEDFCASMFCVVMVGIVRLFKKKNTPQEPEIIKY